jgi:MFS family permease
LWLFAWTWFLYNFSYWMVMSYVPIHLTGLGFSRAEVGYCIATPQFMTLCTVLPFGFLSDRLPARRLSQLGLFLIVLWAVGLAFAPKGPLVYAAFACAGLGMPLHLVSFNALFLKQLGEQSRGKHVGFFVFSQFAGFSLGPFAVPWVLRLAEGRVEGATATFICAALGFTGAFAIVLFVLRDPAHMPFHLGDYVQDVFSKRGLVVTAIILFYSIHFGAEQSFYPQLLREQCELSQLGVGTVYAYSGALVAGVAFLAGRLFDQRQKLLSAMLVGMVLSGVFQAATGLCHSLVQVLGVRTLHTIADGWMNCYITLFVAVAIPQHRMGGNFGFVLAVRTVAILVAASVSGHLVELAGLPLPFFVTGLVCAGAGLTLLAVRPKLKQVMGEA